jgi:hypothetical protein
VLRTIRKSIKRNPVIVAALVAIVAQAIQHAIETNDWNVQTIGTYLLQLAMAYVAREFTVPHFEHQEEVQNAFKQGLERGYVGD